MVRKKSQRSISWHTVRANLARIQRQKAAEANQTLERYMAGWLKEIFEARRGKPAEEAVRMMLSAFAQNVCEDVLLERAMTTGRFRDQLNSGRRRSKTLQATNVIGFNSGPDRS